MLGFAYPTVTGIIPEQGPREGGTVVTVVGTGLHPALLAGLACKIDGLPVRATVLDSERVAC